MKWAVPKPRFQSSMLHHRMSPASSQRNGLQTLVTNGLEMSPALTSTSTRQHSTVKIVRSYLFRSKCTRMRTLHRRPYRSTSCLGPFPTHQTLYQRAQAGTGYRVSRKMTATQPRRPTGRRGALYIKARGIQCLETKSSTTTTITPAQPSSTNFHISHHAALHSHRSLRGLCPLRRRRLLPLDRWQVRRRHRRHPVLRLRSLRHLRLQLRGR